MQDLIAYPDGIFALDSDYLRPQLAAIHLIIHNGEAAVVDTGTNASVARVLGALAGRGVGPEAVKWVILTHIHLDHAGGAGSLLCALPNARLLVHPRGVRHMLDPSQLWAATAEVYGPERAFSLYGRIVPVGQDRVLEAHDGLRIEIGGREFEVLDAPGHARHHIALWDARTESFFVGDTFGLSYRELDVEGRASVLPSTTPTHFDPTAMHETIDRMMSYRPHSMYLTHYSRVTDVERLASDLHRLIDAHVAVALAARGEGLGRQIEIRAGLDQLIRDEAERQGWLLAEEEILAVLETDLELNAQGLGAWLDSGAKL